MSESSELDFGNLFQKGYCMYSFVVPLFEDLVLVRGVFGHVDLCPVAPPFAYGGYVYPPGFHLCDSL